MATINSFEELEIWIKARKLNIKILISKRDSIKKDLRFYSQIRSSSGSIMDNIAKGFERDSRLEFINHLSFPKVHVEKYNLSFIEHLMTTVFLKKN